MNEALNNLLTRRSVKTYKSDQIKPEQLEAILEAGMNAPSGMNAQSATMVVLQDEKTIRKVAKLNADVIETDKDTFYGAPTVIIVFADSDRNTYIEDGSLVMGNLMNAAHAIGVSSCWIHRAKEVFETKEGKELKEKWGIRESCVGIGNCILGYHLDEYPTAKPRKDNYVIYAK